MAQDHYIAKTYLKQFGDSTGRPHGYRKPTGEYFPCYPRDVCREWNGDVIVDFAPKNPTRIGDYRKIFEPRWDRSIAGLLNESLTREGRFAIAAYVANLMFCTPTSTRMGREYHTLTTARLVKFKRDMQRRHGSPVDPRVDEAIEALDSGRLILETEPDYIKARNSSGLIDTALELYHQDWTLLENTTAHPFITSDYPVAFDANQSPRTPFVRFLPITPTRCLCIAVRRPIVTKKEKPPIDDRLSESPRGNLRFAKISAKYAREVTDAVSKCAELYVLSSARSETVETLCRRNGHYEVAFDSMTITSQAEDSELHGVTLTVREKKDAPKKPVRRSSK